MGEDAQILFGRMWNNTAERRIKLLEESFRDVAEDIKQYNYYNEHVTIKSRKDAEDLVHRYAALENAKSRITELLLNFDRATLESIQNEKDNLENFVRYYDWHSKLFSAIESFAKENDQCARVAVNCFNILNAYMKSREMMIWDPLLLEFDTNTSEVKPIDMSVEWLEGYRKKAYSDYMKDLESAFKWIKQQNKTAA
jgi:hypothetical protein